MSRAPHQDVNVMEAGISPGTGDYQNPVQNQVPSNFVDGSGPIFSMYLEMASEEDKKMTEGWKADADGILIFTGLFSAAVASLISVSIQDIRPNPQDTSNFYLANIYQTVSNPNQSNIPLPSSPPPFSPPTYAVWVNSLWFMSLVISLTCALLATLIQQWARRYLKVTQSRYSPHKRARIRAFFAEGVDKYLLPWAVETLPALLHISLFLFFAGLVVFLSNVNMTAFKLVLSWVGVCTALYGCITFMPIFRHDSPYYTSLSSSVWFIVFGIRHVVSQVHWWFVLSVRYRRPVFRRFWSYYHELFLQGMHRTAEETALNSRSEIDTRAFLWTFDRLDEDHELERFFSGLPGFRSSKVVDDPLPSLTDWQKWKLFQPLTGLLERTFSSDLLPAPVKKRRAMICAKAVDPAHNLIVAFNALDIILSNDQDGGPLAAEILQIMRGWGDNTDEGTILVTQATTSSIVARARRRDDPWFTLASDELGVTESVLREYSAHGDSLSLAILIHITRQQFSHLREGHWPSYAFSKVLEQASRFNVQDTSSPELQHEFCALWNQIVLHMRNDNNAPMAFHILRPIRNVYAALHQDTDSAPTQFSVSTAGRDPILSEPSSYPVCNVAGHIHGTVLHDKASFPPSPLANPDAHSSTVLATPHVVESLLEVPPLDHSLPVHQTTIEGLRISVTSPDIAATGAIRDVITSGITVSHYTPDTSTSTPPLSSASLPVTVALQHNANLLTPSDPPNLPSLASSNPVLDNVLPSPPLPSHPPTTRPDLSWSFPKSHRAIMATAPSTSPGPSSTLDLSIAAGDDGSRRDKDVGPPSVNRAIYASTMTTLDLPPQSLSRPSDADLDIVTIVGPSQQAERTGDHSPHPSHCRYDIV